MTIEKTNASAGTLLSDALNNVTSLIRNEVDLAKAELSENLNRAGVAIGLIVGAVVIAIVALTVLAAALVTALSTAGVHAGWAALIVGVELAVCGFRRIVTTDSEKGVTGDSGMMTADSELIVTDFRCRRNQRSRCRNRRSRSNRNGLCGKRGNHLCCGYPRALCAERGDAGSASDFIVMFRPRMQQTPVGFRQRATADGGSVTSRANARPARRLRAA